MKHFDGIAKVSSSNEGLFFGGDALGIDSWAVIYLILWEVKCSGDSNCEMTVDKKCVVISTGSHRTVAGFNNVDLPQCTIPSSYVRVLRDDDVSMDDGEEDESRYEYVFGLFDMMDEAAFDVNGKGGREVFTIVDDHGIPYNWKALERLYRYIYEKELKVDPSELPLVITLPSMTNRELETKIVENYMELAFEKLKVPVLQIVVEPLGIMLSTGKSSSLVIDVGATGCTVTPIIDGTILRNSIVKSRFAGDFLDFQTHKKLEELKKRVAKDDMETDGMEETPQSSLQVWLNANTSIHEFKTSMVSVFDKDLKEVEKYYEEQMRLYRQQQERMAEQQNSQTQQMNQYTIPMNNPNINNPLVQKQNYLLRVKDNKTGAMINRTVQVENKELYEIAEYLFQPKLASEDFSSKDGLGELIGKAIKKSGASVNSNTAGTQVSGSGNSSGGNSGPQTNGPLIPLNGYSSIGFGTSATGAGNDGSATNNITPEHVYSLLLTNVIITGGTSLIDGMEQRIIRELSIRFPQYKLSTFTNPDQLQRSLQAWNGAVSLSNLPKWGLTQWFTKEDFNNHKLKKDNNNVSQ